MLLKAATTIGFSCLVVSAVSLTLASQGLAETTLHRVGVWVGLVSLGVSLLIAVTRLKEPGAKYLLVGSLVVAALSLLWFASRSSDPTESLANP